VTLEGEECLITTFYDLTERRRAEEELKRERDFARGLIESTPAFFVAIDAAGRTLLMNRALLEALGYREEEVVGEDYLERFVPPPEREELKKVFETLLYSDSPSVNLNHVLARDGRELLVEWHGQRVAGGEDGYFFGVGIDVTEREENRRELLRLNADLSAFAHTLSHDLRGPLSNALGYAVTLRMMLEGRLRPDEEECLEVTLRSLKEMDGLIEGMLLYAGMGRAPGEAAEVDLSVTVAVILEELRSGGVLKEGVELRLGRLPTVRGEPLRLRQALYNLISNAAKFSSQVPSPRIEIGLEEKPEGAVVYVRDNGPGIPQDQLERVFEPLARTEGARGLPGHGLGLAIARRAVESWGGRVWAESEPGRGAAFFFTLPPSDHGP